MNPQLDGLLEVRISLTGVDTYEVEVQFDDLSSQGRNEPVRGPATISPKELAALQNQTQAYGDKLAAGLFQNAQVLATFTSARNVIQSRNGRLRISVVIDPAAPELHAIAWELLTDPESKARFSTNEGTPFSRFLFGRDWTPIPLLAKSDLKALLAVSSPSGLSNFGMAPVDAKEEILRAKDALEGIACTVMDGPLTLDALVDAIGRGFDVVYLVCHGALRAPDRDSTAEDFESGFGEDAAVTRDHGIKLPVLCLENTNGEVHWVSGGAFARRLADLGRRPLPRLMVLASCESAGIKGDWTGQSAQASLAPRLARAGVPALVAMQGKIGMETARQFMKPFFSHLVEHGSIDQAVAAARGKVRDRADCWMPALFLRLKDGRLWYEPSFIPGARVNFDSIADEIVAGNFTPIVGWGLAEKIYGTKAGLSERLAEEKRVPLEYHRLGELALVSQYLKVTAKSDTSALKALKDRMRLEVLERFKSRFTEDFSIASLGDVLAAAGQLQRDSAADPYRIIAGLPATVFINASADDLLTDALKAAGKDPLIRTPHWRRLSSIPAPAEMLNPTEASPLVLHVFGQFADPDSLVLGEDDYLDFLMGVAQNQALISNVVKDALTTRALMFLGFQMTDWSFRVLFRIIMYLMAGAPYCHTLNPNVAVQVEPDGSLFSGSEEAKDYLQKFYGPASIEPFWGTSEDFLVEVWPKVKAGRERRKAAGAHGY